jgi:hypothetical protein
VTVLGGGLDAQPSPSGHDGERQPGQCRRQPRREAQHPLAPAHPAEPGDQGDPRSGQGGQMEAVTRVVLQAL